MAAGNNNRCMHNIIAIVSAIETAADRTDWSTEFSWSEQGDEQIALENGICCLLRCVDMHAKERSIPFYCMRMAQ